MAASDPGEGAALHEIADRFFAAIERNDMATVAALYDDGLRAWHSYDQITQNKAENLATVAGIGVIGTARYRVIERHVVGNRLIQRHELTVVAHDGSLPCRLHAAIFLTIGAGRILTLDEYLDSGDVDRLVTAIGGAAAASGQTAA